MPGWKEQWYDRAASRRRTPIAISVDRPAGSVVTVSISGDVDLPAMRIARAAVYDQVRHPGLLLLLDLGGVTFLGMAGLRVLLDLQDTAAAAGTLVRLVHVPPIVVQAINDAGLTDDFDLIDCTAFTG